MVVLSFRSHERQRKQNSRLGRKRLSSHYQNHLSWCEIKIFDSFSRQGLLTRLPGKEGNVNIHQMNADNSNATRTTKRTHKTLLTSRQDKITGVTLKERRPSRQLKMRQQSNLCEKVVLCSSRTPLHQRKVKDISLLLNWQSEVGKSFIHPCRSKEQSHQVKEEEEEFDNQARCGRLTVLYQVYHHKSCGSPSHTHTVWKTQHEPRQQEQLSSTASWMEMGSHLRKNSNAVISSLLICLQDSTVNCQENVKKEAGRNC